MANAKNVSIATELKDKVAKAKSVIVTDYRGLTHKQTEQLHKDLKKADGEYVVVKNSLLSIASKDSSFEMKKEELVGPTAAMFAFGDEISALKELFKFAKTATLPKIKFGFINGVRYDNKQVEAISKLPNQEVLRGQVVSRLSGPLYGMMYALNGNLVKLVTVLGRIQK